LTKIFGDRESSYVTLPQYLDAIKTSNSGSTTAHYLTPYTHELVQFHHVFWVFGLSIEGFQYSRPLLSIDSTHLWITQKLFAYYHGSDANGGLYSLTFTVVEGETKAS